MSNTSALTPTSVGNQSDLLPNVWLSRIFLLALVAPEILDFFAFGSSLARIARLGLLAVAIVQVLSVKASVTKLTRQRLLSIVGMAGLTTVAVTSYLLNAGTFPIYMLSSLVWLVIIANQMDGVQRFLAQAVYASQTLTVLSLVVILLKIPSPFTFAESDSTNYFVPFNSILGLTGRQSGLLSHANQLAPVCVIAIIGALTTRKRMWLIPTYFVTLMTTGSNTSYISACTGIIFMYFGGRYIVRIAIRETLRFSGVIFVGFSLLLIIGYKTLSISDTLLTGRGLIWNQALLQLNGHYSIGLGWQFERRAIANGLLPPFASSVHSTYLEWLTNFGVVGIMCIAPLFVMFLRTLWTAQSTVRGLTATILLFSFSESLINLGSFNLISYLFIFVTWYSADMNSPAMRSDTAGAPNIKSSQATSS